MDGTGKLIIFLLGFANLAGGNCQTSGVCVLWQNMDIPASQFASFLEAWNNSTYSAGKKAMKPVYFRPVAEVNTIYN